MTSRAKEAADIYAALDALEKRLAVDDSDLDSEAAELQNDEPAAEAGQIETEDAAVTGEGGTDVDAGLASKADAITKDEHQQVTQSLTTGWTPKDEGDQNAKANANWPLTPAERETVASKLVKLAEALLR
jgi:hypothetical protein